MAFFFAIVDPSGYDVNHYVTELSQNEVHHIIDKAIQKGFVEDETDPQYEVWKALEDHPDIDSHPSEYIRVPNKFDD